VLPACCALPARVYVLARACVAWPCWWCADEALKADPTNLDVLLSLGVSHTNELDSGEALMYLARWLYNHPSHQAVAETAGARWRVRCRRSRVACAPRPGHLTVVVSGRGCRHSP
jgi:hypothetical protein